VLKYNRFVVTYDATKEPFSTVRIEFGKHFGLSASVMGKNIAGGNTKMPPIDIINNKKLNASGKKSLAPKCPTPDNDNDDDYSPTGTKYQLSL
jgi:hypothetical protein